MGVAAGCSDLTRTAPASTRRHAPSAAGDHHASAAGDRYTATAAEGRGHRTKISPRAGAAQRAVRTAATAARTFLAGYLPYSYARATRTRSQRDAS